MSTKFIILTKNTTFGNVYASGIVEVLGKFYDKDGVETTLRPAKKERIVRNVRANKKQWGKCYENPTYKPVFLSNTNTVFVSVVGKEVDPKNTPTSLYIDLNNNIVIQFVDGTTETYIPEKHQHLLGKDHLIDVLAKCQDEVEIRRKRDAELQVRLAAEREARQAAERAAELVRAELKLITDSAPIVELPKAVVKYRFVSESETSKHYEYSVCTREEECYIMGGIPLIRNKRYECLEVEGFDEYFHQVVPEREEEAIRSGNFVVVNERYIAQWADGIELKQHVYADSRTVIPFRKRKSAKIGDDAEGVVSKREIGE